MFSVVLVLHLLILLALIAVVLLQRSEGGALGIGGGGGGLMTGRGAANALTRTTSWLAAGFFATSIALSIIAGMNSTKPSLLDKVIETPQDSGGTVPLDGPSVPALPSLPAPSEPSVPTPQ